jgi:hypothetical protein
MENQDIRARIVEGIRFMNDGSDNTEYLRGQVELGLFILGATYDDNVLVAELEGN